MLSDEQFFRKNGCQREALSRVNSVHTAGISGTMPTRRQLTYLLTCIVVVKTSYFGQK